MVDCSVHVLHSGDRGLLSFVLTSIDVASLIEFGVLLRGQVSIEAHVERVAESIFLLVGASSVLLPESIVIETYASISELTFNFVAWVKEHLLVLSHASDVITSLHTVLAQEALELLEFALILAKVEGIELHSDPLSVVCQAC